MRLPRSLKWLFSAVLALVIAPLLFVAVFGWNWLQGRNQQDDTARVQDSDCALWLKGKP